MRESLENYVNREPDQHTDPPLPRSAWIGGAAVMALVVAYFAVLFPAEYRHPIDRRAGSKFGGNQFSLTISNPP